MITIPHKRAQRMCPALFLHHHALWLRIDVVPPGLSCLCFYSFFLVLFLVRALTCVFVYVCVFVGLSGEPGQSVRCSNGGFKDKRRGEFSLAAFYLTPPPLPPPIPPSPPSSPPPTQPLPTCSPPPPVTPTCSPGRHSGR